ncbi:hypothetical protein Tco_1467796 [Tanacetum coccineum]
MENQIVWESRHGDLKHPKLIDLVFYGPQRNPNEPLRYLYNKDLFFLKYGILKKENEFKTFNEEARFLIHHWSDTWHKRMCKINHRKVRDDPEEFFSDDKIVEVIRVTSEQ